MSASCARARRGRPWTAPWVWLLAALLLAHALPLAAQAVDPLPFRDRQQELRFQRLTAQLRCLVCQNENLADSNATLARDLRHQVFAQLQAGRSDAQIKQYMVDRYSQFVLYDPPLAPATWLLWFGPLLFLLGGTAMVVATLRRRAAAAAQAPPEQEPEEQW